VTGRIDHAGIVKIFDAGFHGERAFLIMELLQGEPLSKRIARWGRLPVGDAGESAAGGVHRAQAAELLAERVVGALAARLRRHLSPGVARDPAELVDLEPPPRADAGLGGLRPPATVADSRCSFWSQ
jgi:hypothetical protein